MSNAIKYIYCLYKPSSEQAIKNLIQSNNKFLYLKNFSKKAQSIYGEKIDITDADFSEYYYYIENNIPDYWSLYKEVADIHLKLLPTTDAYYALGKYEEKFKKEYSKALQLYQKGYELLEDDVSNKNSFYESIKRVKAKINKSK